MPDLQGEWTRLVDRRLFIPDTIWIQRVERGPLVPLRREDEPVRWEELVLADDPILTQVTDGWPTSSSSAPRVMSRMLDALKLEPGMAVLEIGTGTGWNAALMAAAGAVVTTVEIDQAIADLARIALAEAGYPQIRVVSGDGELGAPDHAPYDRVIATAAAHTVPYPWVEQTADGGLIVFPYTGRHHPCGLAVLTVSGDLASGRIVDDAAFMPLRGQSLRPMQLRKLSDPDPGVVVRIKVGPHGQRVTAQR